MGSRMRYADWLARADTAAPPPTLLAGPETWLRDQALRRLKKGIFGDEERARLGHDRFYGGEGSISQVTNALASVGLFTGTRLVTLAEVERCGRVSPADRKELMARLQAGSPGSVFVALSLLPVRELERKNEFTKAMLQACTVVELNHPSPAEALQWLLEECRQRRLRLAAEAGAYLVEHVGTDLQELSRELEKLQLFAPQDESIDIDTVRNLVRRGAIGSGWRIAASVLEGRPSEALRDWICLSGTEAVMRIQWSVQKATRDAALASRRGTESTRLLILDAYDLEMGIKSGRVAS